MSDKDLTPVLEKATNEELEPLVLCILKKFSEELSSDPLFKTHRPNHKMYISCIEREIRLFGGNTIANTFRGHGPDYFEIVCDVAKKVGAEFKEEWPIAEVELAIIERVVVKAWESMTDQEKLDLLGGLDMDISGGIPAALPVAALQAAIKMSGFAAYKLIAIVANTVTKALIGRGLALGTNAALMRFVGIATGPIGWAATTLWTIFDIASPSYLVTQVCVPIIALLRQKYFFTCKGCGRSLALDAKFCSKCGRDATAPDYMLQLNTVN